MNKPTPPRMTLHWSPRSPFVRKVMVAAHELGLDSYIERRPTVVAMTAPNRNLIHDNPLARIPTLLLDDGTMLTDSTVICEYFDWLAGGGRLFPAAGPARWAELTRHALAQGLLETLVLWRNERDKPDGARTQAWIDTFHIKLDGTLAYFEREFPNAGAGAPGIAAITLGCGLSYLDFRFRHLDWRAANPMLAAWHEQFRARPSARATEIPDDA